MVKYTVKISEAANIVTNIEVALDVDGLSEEGINDEVIGIALDKLCNQDYIEQVTDTLHMEYDIKIKN